MDYFLAVEFGREDGLDELEDFLASFAMWMICLGGVGGTGLLVVEWGLALKTESGGSLLFSIITVLDKESEKVFFY